MARGKTLLTPGGGLNKPTHWGKVAYEKYWLYK